MSTKTAEQFKELYPTVWEIWTKHLESRTPPLHPEDYYYVYEIRDIVLFIALETGETTKEPCAKELIEKIIKSLSIAMRDLEPMTYSTTDHSSVKGLSQ